MGKRLSLLIIAALLLGSLAPTPVSAWHTKVDAWVLQTASQGATEFLVVLSEQADLSIADEMATKLEKGVYAYETLTALAARTQPPVIAALKRYGAEYRPYWVANMIWARGGMEVVQALAQRPDVAFVAANPTVHLDDPLDQQPAGLAGPTAIEWNILKVNADDVWAAGYTGQGVVIGGQDTGYRWDHNALKLHYRGWDGASADHDYDWHDAIHSGGGSCGANAAAPCDDYGHGTHTMGTMVGDDGGSNQVGMAPGAKWIGCRNMDVGDGTPTTYTECFQWFLAPTRVNGQDPRPDLAPHVISNSWGCTPSEGCDAGAVTAMQTVVANVRAAGIVVVASAGNDGSSCNTVNNPPGIYADAFAVGATNSSDIIASFSSRGPADYTGLRKPDISAPGASVRSTSSSGVNSYTSMSGTSMAAPHVAGLVALLISANPALAGDVDAIENAIEQSAVPLTSGETCGGIPGSQVPNNTYGWGRIDAYAALLDVLPHSLEIEKVASAATVQAGGLITYTLTVLHEHPTAATTNVVITDTLPTGTVFVGASGSYSLNGDTVEWSFPTLGAGASQSVTLIVQAPAAPGSVVNAEYGTHSDDVAPVSGPPVTTQVTVASHILEIVKNASAAAVAPGDLITYTLNITHVHPTTATTNVVITDTLPMGTAFVEASGPYSLNGDTVEWSFPSLGAGASQSVTLVVQTPITATGSVVNTEYGVRSADVAPVSGPPVTTNIIAVPHTLEIAKSASAATVQAGEHITYTLTVTHEHPAAAATNVVITDTLPAGTIFVSASGPYTVAGNTITWNVASLGAGESLTVTLTVQVPINATGSVVNAQYGVRSAEAAPVSGPPVTTNIIAAPHYEVYLPLALK